MLKAKNSFWARFSFLKSQKTAAVFLLLLIAGILPVLLFQVKQQQTTQFHAAWYVNRTQHYYCNSALSVDLIIGGINRDLNTGESPDCSSGSNPNASSFQSSMYIKASPGSVGAYAVHWMWAQFWCPNTNTSPCLENGTGQPHTGGLTGDNVAYVIAPSDVKTASSPYSGQACGVYQQDFGFYITDNSDSTQKHLCTSVVLDVNSLGQTNNNASWCNTTKACQGPTNTPAPTNTPTPTHSPTPTQGVTPPTATPTLPVNSPTPTATPSATPTATPSAAPTYTPTPSPTLPPGVPTYTPTPTPTKPATTPVNTPTPAPTVIVVRPTLPPTGPSNTVLAVGLVGLALSVLGAIFLLGI